MQLETETKPELIRVACVGDSLAAAPDYPNELERLLGANYEVGRFGVNSTTVQKNGKKETGDGHGAYVDHPQYRQSVDFRPDIVLLLLGTNDSKNAGDNPGWVTNWIDGSRAAFERDLTALVAAYQALDSHPTVIIGTSPSGRVTPDNWGVDLRVVFDEIVPTQRRVAEKMDCPVADFFTMTRGREAELLGGDGLHPTHEGYCRLAELFRDVIVRTRAAVQVQKI